jgi:Fe2+ transport system protein FeoA
MNPGELCEIVGVKAHEADFLQYLDGMNLVPGVSVEVKKRYSYDQSLVISVEEASDIMVSSTVSRQLLVRKKS